MLCVQKFVRRKALHLLQRREPPATAKTRYLFHGCMKPAINRPLGTEDLAAPFVLVSTIVASAEGTNAVVASELFLYTSLVRLTY